MGPWFDSAVGPGANLAGEGHRASFNCALLQGCVEIPAGSPDASAATHPRRHCPSHGNENALDDPPVGLVSSGQKVMAAKTVGPRCRWTTNRSGHVPAEREKGGVEDLDAATRGRHDAPRSVHQAPSAAAGSSASWFKDDVVVARGSREATVADRLGRHTDQSTPIRRTAVPCGVLDGNRGGEEVADIKPDGFTYPNGCRIARNTARNGARCTRSSADQGIRAQAMTAIGVRRPLARLGMAARRPPTVAGG